ncbi:MAG: AzlD domain-containing protein [Candidatus Nanopelagicales bacterium]
MAHRAVTMIWAAVLLGSLGTYVEKLVGFFLPRSLLERSAVRRVAGLLPVALLAALVAVQTFAVGQTLVIDARLAGLLAAIVALLLRAPFIVVVLVAAVVAAVLRAAGLAT